MRLLAVAALSAACLVLSGVGHAITPGLGEFRAVSNGAPIPPGTAVAILPDATDAIVGNAPAYVAARATAAEGLRGLGLRPDDSGRYTLKIELTTPHFDTHRNGDDAAGSFVSSDAAQQPGPGRKRRVIDQVALPFDEPETNGNPGLSLSLILTDERNRPVWTATFQAGGRVQDAEAMIRRMTRAAVASLGAQVERSYVLACEGVDTAPQPEGSICLP
jgi:hypothetical protein